MNVALSVSSYILLISSINVLYDTSSVVNVYAKC